MSIVRYSKAKSNLTNNQPYEISEVICLKCLNRWIAVYPQDTLLKDLECKCDEVGAVIKTGQDLPDILPDGVTNDVRYQNLVKEYGEDVAIQIYKSFCIGAEI